MLISEYVKGEVARPSTGNNAAMHELAGALRPRYAVTPATAGIYESLYLTAHHPSEPQALWVRHTVLKPPEGPPRASLWCTWFGTDGVRAAKVSTPDVSSTPERPLQVGEHGWIGVDGATGAVDLDSLKASWELQFKDPEPPMFHLPKPWMYTAPVPRTKSISAAPRLRLAGSRLGDGLAVDIDGWPCTIGHNWGVEHAERWLWLHADGDADEGPVWLDAIVGRIRLGPVTTPWIANGAVSIAGRRHRLGGLRLGFNAPVSEHDRARRCSCAGPTSPLSSTPRSTFPAAWRGPTPTPPAIPGRSSTAPWQGPCCASNDPAPHRLRSAHR
jgi:hypothetical protein